MLSELVGMMGEHVHQLALNSERFEQALIQSRADAEALDRKADEVSKLDAEIATRRGELDVLAGKKQKLEDAINRLRQDLAGLGIIVS